MCGTADRYGKSGKTAGFFGEIGFLAGDDSVFRCLHLQKFLFRDLQEIGKSQLFVDAVGAVKAIAVGTHDAGDAVGQVAFQRMGA